MNLDRFSQSVSTERETELRCSKCGDGLTDDEIGRNVDEGNSSDTYICDNHRPTRCGVCDAPINKHDTICEKCGSSDVET